MSRYSIALGKTQDQKPKTEVIRFGIEEEIKGPRNFRTFRLGDGETARVRMLFNNPDSMFFGTKIHWYGTTGFFCKSTSERLAACCTTSYNGRKPVFRIAAILRVLSQGSSVDSFMSQGQLQVLPWTFGKLMFEKLKSMNDIFALRDKDLILEKERGPYNLYRVTACENKLETPMDERAQEIASNLIRNIKNYLGKELDEPAIQELLRTNISEPPVRSAGRLQMNEVQIRDLLDDLDETPAPPVRRRRASREGPDINLDDLFRTNT